MVLNVRKMKRSVALVAGVVALSLVSGPVMAQSSQQGIDSDLVKPGQDDTQAQQPLPPASPAPQGSYNQGGYNSPTYNNAQPNSGYTSGQPYAPQQQAPGQAMPPANPTGPQGPGGTYHEDDLIGAATGVFGTGAKGLAEIIRGILKKQGEPDGYIVGREAGGAFVAGLRYGSGTLYHKIEGQRPVYWAGPSLGFDAGASAGKTFVLVYNLHNTDDLFHRYGAGEGQAYLVGGFHVSYLRRGDVVLIPVRMGVGLRLGVNGGYMKFTQKQTWLPF